MPNIYTAFHLRPKDCEYDFILLPIGLLYNVPIQHAKKGDIFEFQDGGSIVIEAIEVKFIRDVYVDCKLRYGISINRAIAKWKAYAELTGESKDVVSSDRCLKIWYRNGKEELRDGDC